MNYPDILYIDVTQKDINKAIKYYEEYRGAVGVWSHHCPISLAVKRMYPDVDVATFWNVRIIPPIDEPVRYTAPEVRGYATAVDELLDQKQGYRIKPIKLVVTRINDV